MNQLFGSQFWIFLLVFGFGAVSWLVRQLQEQARIRQAKERAKRQYEEHLRTGRPAPDAPPPAQREPRLPRPDDLVARRQAQLNELRRRQAQGSPLAGAGMIVKAPTSSPRGMGGARSGGAVPPSGVVIQRVPAGAGSPIPPRRSAPARPAPASPAVRPAGPGSQLSETRRREQAQREAVMRQLELQERARLEAERRRRSEQAAAEERQQERERVAAPAIALSPLHGPDGQMKSAAELRHLLVASEILGRPVCDREELV